MASTIRLETTSALPNTSSGEKDATIQRAIDDAFAEIGATVSDGVAVPIAIRASVRHSAEGGKPSPPVTAPRSQHRRLGDIRAYHHQPEPDQSSLFAPIALAVCVGLAGLSFFNGIPTSWQASIQGAPTQREPRITWTVTGMGNAMPRAKRIEDVDVGDRIEGTNPLREQVDEEPDPKTWRKISFHMRKQSGLSLWFDLLRLLNWVDANDIEMGRTVHVDLPEMGAVGDAEVTYFGPCPEIEQGEGAVVTGKFKHESDGSQHVVELRLEADHQPTVVTENHPYWSIDRHAFVPVGQLRKGEHVKTRAGNRRVVSVVPRQHTGLLYNLETTEHVFQVGSLGALVHNSCLGNNLRNAGSYGAPGADAHHIVAAHHRSAAGARSILQNFNIDIDSHFNGAWLPTDAFARGTRGAIHESLHNAQYFQEVESRLRQATTRAQAINALQKIRSELLNGTFPGVRGFR